MIAEDQALNRSSWRTVVSSVFRGRVALAAREKSGPSGSAPRPVRKLRANSEGFGKANPEQTRALASLMSLVEVEIPTGTDSRADLSWRAQSWRWERIHALLAEKLLMGAADPEAAARQERTLEHAIRVEAQLVRSLSESLRARHRDAMEIVRSLEACDDHRR